MTRLRAALAHQSISGIQVVGLVVAFGYLAALAWAMTNTTYDVWGALVVGPVLIALTAPLARHVARQDGPEIARLVLLALVLKLAGGIVRYAVAFEVYGGLSDSLDYDFWGKRFAPLLRSGDTTIDVGRGLIGTGFIQVLTGGVYALIGPTMLGGFLVFSYLGFWGLYLLFRAFRIGVPDGDSKRYALLLFFLPSMLFWPSSIGKEAWMLFTLGITAYGCARMLMHLRGGFACFGLGLAGTVLVRPHVTLIVFMALAVAYVLRRSRRASLIGPAAKAVGVVTLTLVGLVVVSQTESFLGVDRLDTRSADRKLAETTATTDEASSQFEAVRPDSPVGMVNAIGAVLFRPWPFEANNPQALFASAEGLTVLGLTVLSLRRLVSLPRQAIRTPYVAFALVYSLIFVWAFASIGNFGNIARQRVQLFPFVLVLLAIPVVSDRISGGGRSGGRLTGDAARRDLEPVDGVA